MSDSIVNTNIPKVRLPFGSEIPPHVPYVETDSVGVGSGTDQQNLPVYVSDRKIVPVGDSASNPIRGVFLDRKMSGGSVSGRTVNDVPTSATPDRDSDPDTMIATKRYADDVLTLAIDSFPYVNNTDYSTGQFTRSGTTMTYNLTADKSRLVVIDFSFDRTNASVTSAFNTPQLQVVIGGVTHTMLTATSFPTNRVTFQISLLLRTCTIKVTDVPTGATIVTNSIRIY